MARRPRPCDRCSRCPRSGGRSAHPWLGRLPYTTLGLLLILRVRDLGGGLRPGRGRRGGLRARAGVPVAGGGAAGRSPGPDGRADPLCDRRLPTLVAIAARPGRHAGRGRRRAGRPRRRHLPAAQRRDAGAVARPRAARAAPRRLRAGVGGRRAHLHRRARCCWSGRSRARPRRASPCWPQPRCCSSGRSPSHRRPRRAGGGPRASRAPSPARSRACHCSP